MGWGGGCSEREPSIIDGRTSVIGRPMDATCNKVYNVKKKNHSIHDNTSTIDATEIVVLEELTFDFVSFLKSFSLMFIEF